MFTYGKGSEASMKICESHLNATEGYLLGDDVVEDVAATVLDGMTDGEIFRWLRSSGEYGRCVSKVYVGEGTPVGWVFVKRDRYEDTGEAFLHETWVTLMDRDETIRERDYHELQVAS